MEAKQADQLIAIYGNRFPFMSIEIVRQRLLEMDYHFASMFLLHMKDPTTSIILSILVGQFGLDRIYIGDIGLGILKLFTCGGLGVWWIIDLFEIMDKTKKINLQIFLNYK